MSTHLTASVKFTRHGYERDNKKLGENIQRNFQDPANAFDSRILEGEQTHDLNEEKEKTKHLNLRSQPAFSPQ